MATCGPAFVYSYGQSDTKSCVAHVALFFAFFVLLIVLLIVVVLVITTAVGVPIKDVITSKTLINAPQCTHISDSPPFFFFRLFVLAPKSFALIFAQRLNFLPKKRGWTMNAPAIPELMKTAMPMR